MEKLRLRRGFFHLVLFPSLLAAAPAGPIPAAQAPPRGVVEELIARAEAGRLYEDPQWIKLLHYRRRGKGVVSDIDGGYFFLSPRGKTDSRAEMAATLRALFSEQDLSPPLESGLEAAAMHPLCKFRARLRFFRARLAFPDSLLPAAECERYDKWRAALNPKGATLVFASSYLNNPASMFGHTFLRLDTYAGGSDRAILNYGVSYGAEVPPGENFAFVYRGLFGKYRASYSLAPYYMSLQKYSHLESRDIWEYELGLDSLQLEGLLEHVWELGACWMEYYFFDENCSYNILTLLDAAVPEADLSAGMDPWVVIPAETVKLLRARKGLIKDARWRPSLLTNFRLKAAAMGPRERQSLRRMIGTGAEGGAAARIPRDTLAAVMDAALDYLQYRKRRAEGKSALSWSDRQRRLLMARAAYPQAPAIFPVRPDAGVSPPEAGHSGSLLGATMGLSAYRPYWEFRYRLAYHDLNAAEPGFLEGSQVEALHLRLRVACRGRNCGELPGLEVRTADVLDLMSLTPMDGLRQPLSWAARVGYETRPRGNHQDYGSFTAEGGVGASALWPLAGRWKPYILLQGKTRWAAWEREANLGPQAKLGVKWGMGRGFSLLAEHRHYLPLLGPGGRESDWRVEGRLSAGRNGDLRVSWANLDGVGEGGLAWNAYF